MGKYKHWWRPNVERALREYPGLKAKQNAMHEMSITPNYSAVPGGNEASRKTEVIAIRELPAEEERWIDAIDSAIAEVRRHKDGPEILRIVDECYFRRSLSLTAAAMAHNMDTRTALRRRNRFIFCVAKYIGYFKEDA